MSGCEDQTTECPLCMEPLEMDDINFFPCTCGYQICRFCWHRIRTNENGLCPACRKQYPEDPADFKPLTQEELQRIKNEKRQKDLQKKLKISENRKHLSNVRVVQKNLVFVVGLAHRLADPEVLKKHEYFGKFGKIHKVVINHSTTYAGSQGPSASAYVTYYRVEDALRAIQSVNNVHVDGRTLKASLGTTKYCSHFLKGQQCPKTDCMYLHELGDDAASFTKEEMQQGKHQEYEKKLHEQLFNSIRKQATSPTNNSSSPTNSNSTSNNSLAQEPDASTRDSWPALRSGSGSSNSSSNSYRGSKQPGKLENGFSQTRNGIRTRTESGEDNNVNRNKGLDDFPIESNNHLGSGFNSFSPRSLQSSENGMDSPHQNNMSYIGSVGTNGGSANSATCNAIANSIPSSFNSNLSNGPSLSQTSSGAGSPSQSLANLDSSSSSSSSSPDNVTPYFESRNGFTEASNSLQPVTNSLNDFTLIEWTNNLTIENNIDPPPVEAPRQENTDWQAAFGFSSPTREPPRDDDLGFDPWDESKKGLADLIEKESSGRPHVSPAYIHNVNHGFQYGEASNTHHHHQLKQQQHIPNLVHMNSPLQPQPPHHHPQSARRLGAPPGFFPNAMTNPLKMTRPYQYDEYQLHHSLMNPHPYSNPSFSNLTKAHHMKEVNLHESQGNIRHYGTKESQDNLRALFPNVNITFGNNSGPLSQQPNCTKSWHCGGNNDSSWPIQDPAVVSAGGVSEGRPESPPHWMSSIHQLTELDYPVNYNSHQFPVNQFQNRHLPGWSNQSQTPPGFGNPLRLAFRSNEPQKIMDTGNF